MKTFEDDICVKYFCAFCIKYDPLWYSYGYFTYDGDLTWFWGYVSDAFSQV